MTNNSKSYLLGSQRMSNMELLRILAMFLVLAVHANFYALGTTNAASVAADPVASATRVVLCITSCMCVNIFILISGWFSIKPSIKGFCKFAFQCLYFTVGIYAVMLLLNKSELNFLNISRCFFFTSYDWFVKAYIGLYIIAPALNAFTEKATKTQLQYFLVAFYLFQTIYSIRGSAPFIASGYSTFSFIGLYMIGRYLSRYGASSLSTKSLLILVCIPILLTSSVYYIDSSRDAFNFSGMCMSYANPIMIIAASALLLLFTRLNIRCNPVINFISASSFAVYLFHYDPHILNDYFCRTSQEIYNMFDGIFCLSIEFIFISLFFAISVILDQPRILIWKIIETKMFPTKVQTEPEVSKA